MFKISPGNEARYVPGQSWVMAAELEFMKEAAVLRGLRVPAAYALIHCSNNSRKSISQKPNFYNLRLRKKYLFSQPQIILANTVFYNTILYCRSGFDCVVKRLRMALYKPDCDFNDCELPSGQYTLM